MRYKRLIEGIRWNEKNQKFDFDFKSDLTSDIISLQWKGKYTKKSVRNRGDLLLYFGFKVHSKANRHRVNELLKTIKYKDFNKLLENDYNLFLTKAVLGFDRDFRISSFDIIVTPESSSKLLKDLAQKIKNKAPNTLLATDILIKNSIDNIYVDYEKIKSSSLRKRMEDIMKAAKESKQLSLKRIPPILRRQLRGFMVFKNDIDRRIFNAIQNGKVLLLDDILVTGTTLTDMLREVYAYLPTEIVVFILISTT